MPEDGDGGAPARPRRPTWRSAPCHDRTPGVGRAASRGRVRAATGAPVPAAGGHLRPGRRDRPRDRDGGGRHGHPVRPVPRLAGAGDRGRHPPRDPGGGRPARRRLPAAVRRRRRHDQPGRRGRLPRAPPFRGHRPVAAPRGDLAASTAPTSTTSPTGPAGSRSAPTWAATTTTRRCSSTPWCPAIGPTARATGPCTA